MRRSRPSSRTICTLASLVLLTLFTTSFIAGFFEMDQFDHASIDVDSEKPTYVVRGLGSVEGRLIAYLNTGWTTDDADAREEFAARFASEPRGWRAYWLPKESDGWTFSDDRWWNRIGFEYADTIDVRSGVTTRSRQVVIPTVLPLAVSAILPATAMYRWGRRRVGKGFPVIVVALRSDATS